MSSHSMKLREAYLYLGLEEGCSFEAVKSSYKAAALRTHPDKNPDNPEATVEFQRVGEAYRVLSNHFTNPGYSDDDFYDDYDSDDDFPLFASAAVFEFFMDSIYTQIFEEMMSGSAPRHYSRSRRGRPTPSAYSAYSQRPSRHHHEQRETQQQYKERLERQRKSREEAQERREREEKIRKARRENEREQEAREAAQRQKQKHEDKKVKAEAQRKKAEEASRLQYQKSQKLRSQVFRAARGGDIAKVKEGIWEHSVDATGGEVGAGGEEFLQSKPKDLKETLLHIAVKQDHLDLVEWLVAHGADIEERNSQGYTALHTAVQLGRITIVKYIVETYPPDDSKAIYETPKGRTLLALAVESKEPELVWVVLENKLAGPEDINKAWQKATSSSHLAQDSEKHSDIVELLKTYGGFTPPPTPHAAKGSSMPFQSNGKPEPEKAPRKGHAGKSQGSSGGSADLPPADAQGQSASQPKGNQQQQKGANRGRGGRGRGRGRGRGAGQAQR